MPASRRIIEIEPPKLGRTPDGLAYALFTPAEPRGGVVILHGADSSKESHFDFARLCRAHDLAAVCFDARGHGESDGALDVRIVDDIVRIAELLPAGPVGLRGSSMGGWMALVSAARLRAEGVVAICPATTEVLMRGLQERRFAFEFDAGVLDVLAHVDLDVAAHDLGERLLLMHAEGDEVVPVEHSRRLHALAAGSRFVETPGGHHRSIQHDAELQAVAVRFLTKRLAAA